jgi:hypothetical protein
MVVALVFLVLYGLPTFLLLRRIGWANLVTCSLAALIPSTILALAGGHIEFLMSYGLISLASALAFWGVAREFAVVPQSNFLLQSGPPEAGGR